MKRKLIATLLLAVHLTGCHSWYRTTTDLAQLLADEQPSKVRVTRKDGTQWTLRDGRIRNDSIDGFAVSDVRTIEVRSLNTGKTVGLVVGVPVGIFASFLLLIVAAGEPF